MILLIPFIDGSCPMMGHCVRTAAGRKGTTETGKKEGKKLEYNYMLGIEENFHCKKWLNFANFFSTNFQWFLSAHHLLLLKASFLSGLFSSLLNSLLSFFSNIKYSISNIKLLIKHYI